MKLSICKRFWCLRQTTIIRVLMLILSTMILSSASYSYFLTDACGNSAIAAVKSGIYDTANAPNGDCHVPIMTEDNYATMTAAHGNEVQNNAVSGELIVKFKRSTSKKTMDDLTTAAGDKTVEEIKNSKTRRIRLSAGDSINSAIEQYEKTPGVEYAEPNYVREAFAVPNDAYWSYQWDFTSIKAPQAWDVTTGDDILVAVIDTGIDYEHEDLADVYDGGYDFVNADSNPMDDHGHGTHVAGTIAADSNNGIGVTGMSWGARLLGLKVLDADGSGYDFDIAQALEYAADNGARIINLSLGGPGYSATLADAVKYAQDRGCVVIAAAGNSDSSTPSYPAAFSNVIGVSATGYSGSRADYSNYGWYVDVAAPGGDNDGDSDHMILSCDIDDVDSYIFRVGTSMAAPHVAGMAALIASKYPALSGAEITRVVLHAADDIGVAGRDNYYGYGLIDAQAAVTTDFGFREETSTATGFSGSWNASTSNYASGGGYKYSAITGDYAICTFYGTGISWVASTGTSYGKARIYIDNVDQGDSSVVDLYGTSDSQKPVYTKTGLTLGEHTIKIMVTGTKNSSSSGFSINVDAFDIYSVELPTPSVNIVGLSNDVLDIGWDAFDEEYGLDHYRVNVATDETDTSANTTDTTFNLTATTDTTYSISVAACGGIDNESQSETMTATLSDTHTVSIPALNDVYAVAYSVSGRPPSTLFFDSVSEPGAISITETATAEEELPEATIVGNYINIVNSAVFAGDVGITLPYDDTGLSSSDEQSLKIYRYESGSWSDCTASIDTANNLIVGETDSLLLFAIGNPDDVVVEISDSEDDGGGGGGGGGTSEVPKIPEELEIETETVEKAPTPTFSDLQKTNWAYDYIAALIDRGIVSGYKDGTFRPSASVTRAEFAKMICLAMGWDTDVKPRGLFNDVPIQHWASSYIETARAHQVLSGYPNGSFNPGKNVTRAEISKMIAGALNLNMVESTTSNSKSSFKDIGSHWAKSFIAECDGAGIIGGYPGNVFKPDATASRAEAAKMMALSIRK